jgi:PPP family 3-phenylpropionic acid transporter
VASRLLTRPALHTAGFYVALFMANGVLLPFWPIWLEDWGLSTAEVGMYTALGMAVRVVAGVAVPALADRFDARRHTIAACAAITVLLFLAHLGITTKAVLLLATLAAGVSMAGLGPIGEALGVAAARFWQFPYAQVRGVGSLGFLAANLLVGSLIARTGSWIALWWIVACMTAVAALAVHHPGGRRVKGQTPPRLGEIRRLMTNPVFALFMGAVAAIQASHAVMYALGTLHWLDLGVGAPEIGALWAVAVGAEILFLLFAGTGVVQAIGPVRALVLSGIAAVVRWGAMMFDPTGFWLWPIQSLHAMTFALCHLGVIAFISRAVPDRYSAAAQGATGAMAVGGVMALAMVLASLVYPTLGGLTYGIGVALSAAGVALAAMLAGRWSGGEIAVRGPDGPVSPETR